jgi:hypothetical protein
LRPLVGELPSIKNIDKALSLAFDNEEFLVEENWTPEGLLKIATAIQSVENYNLDSREFKPRIIAVLLTGMEKMKAELVNGLDAFYREIDSVREPVAMIRLINSFSRVIKNVGPVLVSDFFKNIGFTNYVKIDYHFRNEFPKLMTFKTHKKDLSFRESFILSQEIAKELGYTPFYIDALLYLWGRYGKINTH